MSTMQDELIWHKTINDGPSEMQKALEQGLMIVIEPTMPPKENK